jgi:exo-beta-1,3-glucanase (GH17 family)
MKTTLARNPATRLLGALILCATWLPLAMPCRAANSSDSPPAAADIRQSPDKLLCGVRRGVCYSGFRAGQHPDRGDGAVNPSDAEVLEDLQILGRKGNFRLIRLYDSRANSETVLRLIQSRRLNLKVLLGAWLDAEVSNPNCPWHKEPYPAQVLETNRRKNGLEIESAIRLANQYSNVVVAVAVGNEALVDWTDHKVSVDAVMGYVRKVKKSIAQPVTVADNYNWWAHGGADLARELDFVSVHTYPLWDGKDIDEAMSWSIANVQAVRNALPHSRLVITEAGWATIASEFGPRAGEEYQKRYFQSLYAWGEQMNITVFFFEAFDEDWKGDSNNPLGAEKHWGLFNLDRTPKLAMQALYPDLVPKKAARK